MRSRINFITAPASGSPATDNRRRLLDLLTAEEIALIWQTTADWKLPRESRNSRNRHAKAVGYVAEMVWSETLGMERSNIFREVAK